MSERTYRMIQDPRTGRACVGAGPDDALQPICHRPGCDGDAAMLVQVPKSERDGHARDVARVVGDEQSPEQQAAWSALTRETWWPFCATDGYALTEGAGWRGRPLIDAQESLL